MTATIVVLALAAILFVSGKIRSDFIAVCASLALILAGVLSPEEAFAGFANPVVIMMAGLFVVGGGIFGTGLAKMVGNKIVGLAGQSETRLFVLLMLATAGIGAFVSNTGTVALMMPIVVSMARSAGMSSRRLLMPLAFAGSMGGLLTLIGTPPNLIVRDALAGAGYGNLTFFSFTPIGLVSVAVGLAVLFPLSKWVLSGKYGKSATGRKDKTLSHLADEYNLSSGLSLLRVAAGSPSIGKSVSSLDVYGKYGITIMEVRRTIQKSGLLKRMAQYAPGNVELQEGDILLASGNAEKMAAFTSDCGLESIEGREASLRFYDIGMAEVLLLSTSSLLGNTVGESGLRSTYGLNVMGIRRHEAYLLDDIKNIRLHSGDIVLVQGAWDNIAKMSAQEREWVVLGQPLQQAAKVTLDYKAPLAALIMILMVVVMAVDAIPIAPVTAVVAAAVLMVATGCLRSVESAVSFINWESVILFAAMLPMSTALEKTGISAALSQTLVEAVTGHSPYLLMAAIYAATSFLTFFISNTVTAVLMAPIALSAASGAGISAVPLLMGVTVAASMCFASPFSTPPNALVMSAGGYKPIDYIKVGLPLQLVMGLAMILAIPLFFPF